MFQLLDVLRIYAAARFSNERGAVATEYAVLIAFMVVLIVAGVTAFGGDVSAWFSGLVDGIGG